MTEREDVLESLANYVRSNEKARLEFCKNVGITLDEYYVKRCGDFEIEDMIRAFDNGRASIKTELEAQIEQLTYLHNEDVSTIKLLNEQIKKMKGCENCKYKYIQDSCDLGEGTRTDPCLSCRSNNMWEFDNE